MARKNYTTEQIIGKLRQAEVMLCPFREGLAGSGGRLCLNPVVRVHDDIAVGADFNPVSSHDDEAFPIASLNILLCDLYGHDLFLSHILLMVNMVNNPSAGHSAGTNRVALVRHAPVLMTGRLQCTAIFHGVVPGIDAGRVRRSRVQRFVRIR